MGSKIDYEIEKEIAVGIFATTKVLR